MYTTKQQKPQLSRVIQREMAEYIVTLRSIGYFCLNL